MCDHRISVDAVRCPNCNAVFSLCGVDELQKVARELNGLDATDKPSEVGGDPPRAEGNTIADGHKMPETSEPKGKNSILGKLFKKKK